MAQTLLFTLIFSAKFDLTPPKNQGVDGTVDDFAPSIFSSGVVLDDFGYIGEIAKL